MPARNATEAAVAIIPPEMSVEPLSNDLLLARRLANRDPVSMNELISQHGDYLRNFIAHLTAWSPDTDDLLQETLIRAWNKAGSYRNDSSLRTWLTTIAIRICQNHYRSLNRVTRTLKQLWHQRQVTLENMPGESDDPRWQQIQQAMQRLSPVDREVLVVIHVHHLSIEDAALQLDIRVNALNVRLHRARQRLKQLLENTCE